MNLFAFALCFIAVPCAFGNNSPQNLLEIDRARSSWNFGGHQPIKKSTYWNRPKNVAGPGSILANRRMGSGSAPMAPYRKISQTPSGAPQKRRQSKPYASRAVQQGRSITKRHTNFPFPSQPGAPFPQPHHISYFSSQQQRTPSSPWYRSSRKLSPTVDTIKSRFMKEDLWHLDKGESYIVKDEDLERDSALRNRHYESNDIDGETFSVHDEEVLHHQQLETEAENMVNQAEKANNGDTEKDNTPQHIHHHHHYEVENAEKQPGKPEAQKMKPAASSNVVAAPLPRIHNPIPLGCLLAVPVFHPIRPRHHLACLLSIPGTPSLTRRRRRRSADSPALQIPNTSAQSQSFLQQLFGGSNSKMTPIVTRKHYASHVGNGKNPGSSASTPQNFKVPASIIVPPKFDQEDILSMLLGSGGVSVDKMGAIVATNNRYVRYGRGLPNSQSNRQGRHINWMPEPKVRNPSAKHIPQSSAPMQTNGNHIPSATKSPLPAKKPLVQLTPFPKKSPVYVPQKQYFPSNIPQAPFILNVQISPSSVTRPSSGPVISVPIQQQSQQPHHHEHHQHVTNNTPNEQKQQQNHQSTSELEPIHEHHHHHHDHSHYEEPHPSTTEQPQQPQEQLSTAESQPQSSTEVQPSTVSSEQEQQASSEDQQVSIVKEKAPTVPYQTGTISPSGKLQKFDTFKYTEWMPVSKGKPHKPYYYEYVNSDPESAESKALYRNVKPFSFSSQDKELDSESSYYYENINDQLADSGVTGIDSLSDYYSVLNVHSSPDKAAYLKGKAYWQDVNHEVSNGNVAYAVKKNYKEELDNVLQGIASRERGIYSDVRYYPESNDFYDNINIDQSSYADNDNSAYSQEKYYTVKKLPTQLPDPIYVSVPKEDEFSNELYDVKK